MEIDEVPLKKIDLYVMRYLIFVIKKITMRKYFLAGIFGLAFASCSKERVRGSGAISTEQRTVSDFSHVFVSGATDVHITQGSTLDVKVKAYDNLLPYLETKSANGTLTIAYRSNSNISNDNSEVFITMPVLAGLSTNGSGNINTSGSFEGGDQFTLSIAGSGDITIEGGNAGNLKIDISGSGNVKSFGFLVQKADVDIKGSGDASVHVTQDLKVSINGSGSVYYKGNPPVVNSQISGSGKLVAQ